MSVDRPRSSKDEGWLGWLPGIATLQRYEAPWLPGDIAAGLVLTTTLAPVGIAYAVASGLPGACGLYARLYRIQRWEFWLSIVCFAGVAVFGAIPGIGLAVVLAVIDFLWDGWRPHSAVLGRVEGVRGYHDITRYPHARQLSGLLLFRWDAPLFSAATVNRPSKIP